MAWGECQICHRDKELVDGKLPKHEDPNGNGLCRGGEEPPLAGFDAVDMARTTHCPYCTKSVALLARTLGSHRAHGGVCDGSGRRVAEFDYAGRAVLEAQTEFGLGDLPGELDSKIAQVKQKIRDLRGYQADPSIAKQISDLENWLRSVGASA